MMDCYCSFFQAVRSYFDIQSIPKRYFFELLSHFTTDELEKEKFLEFNTAEGGSFYDLVELKENKR